MTGEGPTEPAVYGGHVDADIHYLLREYPELIGNFPLALVTVLDSGPHVPTTSRLVEKALETTGAKSSQVGESLLVSGSDLVEMEEACQLFFGFDEVWLFRQRPVEIKTEGVTILPTEDLNEGVSSEVEEWTLASGCVLGLGDGIGLNYVTVDRGIADYLNSFGVVPVL